MTAPATTRRAGPFNGNGATTSFPFTFKVFTTADVAVVKTSTTGAETTLTLGTHYSITLNSDQDASPGGSITYPISGTPLATGEKLTATGSLPYDQTADLPTGGNYRAVVVENALDRGVMQMQQLAEAVSRALTVPVSSASASAALPAPIANYLLGWNPTADAIVNRSPIDVAGSTGSTWRDFVSVVDYGATGNGSTDDTAAIQAALNTGFDVYVPPASSYYKISSELAIGDNQRIFGAGLRSRIVQTTTLLNVLRATNRTGVKIHSLRLTAVGDFSGYSTGGGALLIGCSKSQVATCHVDGHRGAGVNLYNSNDCEVAFNFFTASPVQDLDLNTECLADVAVVYSSSRNRVHHNFIDSGNGTGVQIQTVALGDNCDSNIVTDNIVRNCKAYGIIAYRNDDNYPSADSVRGNIIANNRIFRVHGTIENVVLSNYSFGAGIYVQGAEETVVANNNISGSHYGSVTFGESLAPGAIGLTNQRRAVVVGNVIDDCGMFGIHVGDGNTIGEPLGFAVVSGNAITNCARGGINVSRRGFVNIIGNTIDTCADSGIEVNNIAGLAGIAIRGNTVRNVTGTSGIEVKYATRVDVVDNTVDTVSTHGISVQDCTDARIKTNRVKDHVSSGIYVLASATNTRLIGNDIDGTGSSSIGYRLEAPTFRDDSNKVTGCTSTWGGAYAPFYTLTVNSATPTVLHAKEVKTVNTLATTITSFADGVEGQELTVVFADGNTTLDFTSSNLRGNGGSDRAMSAGDAITAKFYGGGLNVWYCTVIDV